MRNLVVLLTIVAVLACPYECMAKSAAAYSNSGMVELDCCEACHLSRPSLPSDQHDSHPPAPDEDGCWCLCEGAVFDVGARPQVNEFLKVALWVRDANSAKLANQSLPALSRDDLDWPPPIGGQSFRIAIHSLLL